jgi:hypothetical protein
MVFGCRPVLVFFPEFVVGPSRPITLLLSDPAQLPVELQLFCWARNRRFYGPVAIDAAKLAINDIEGFAARPRLPSALWTRLTRHPDGTAFGAISEPWEGASFASSLDFVFGALTRVERPFDRIIWQTMSEDRTGMIKHQSIELAGMRPQSAPNHLEI